FRSPIPMMCCRNPPPWCSSAQDLRPLVSAANEKRAKHPDSRVTRASRFQNSLIVVTNTSPCQLTKLVSEGEMQLLARWKGTAGEDVLAPALALVPDPFIADRLPTAYSSTTLSLSSNPITGGGNATRWAGDGQSATLPPTTPHSPATIAGTLFTTS